MSVIPSILARPAATRDASAFARLCNDCWNGMIDHFVRRAAVKTLRELDDRALRDIGLSRSQIEAAVQGGITLPDLGRM